MKRLAIAALLVTAATGCSSTSTTAPTESTPAATSRSTPAATPSATSTPSSATTTEKAAPPSSPAANAAESLGQRMGEKIAFYAVAKAAGMDDSDKMDQLASGICSRIESGKPATVGSWMKDAFELEGDIAAKVAIAAITSECPEFKSLMG